MPIQVFLTWRAAPGRARRRSGARARWPGRRRSRSRTAPRQLPRIRMVRHPSNNFERTLKKFKLVRSCLGYVETRPYYLAYCARTEKHELSEEDDAFQNYVILFHATTATDFGTNRADRESLAAAGARLSARGRVINDLLSVCGYQPVYSFFIVFQNKIVEMFWV